jgi:hypothetical protein
MENKALSGQSAARRKPAGGQQPYRQAYAALLANTLPHPALVCFARSLNDEVEWLRCD